MVFSVQGIFHVMTFPAALILASTATVLIDGLAQVLTLHSKSTSHNQLNILQPTFIGGVPDSRTISPEAAVNDSFTGCISE